MDRLESCANSLVEVLGQRQPEPPNRPGEHCRSGREMALGKEEGSVLTPGEAVRWNRDVGDIFLLNDSEQTRVPDAHVVGGGGK